MEDAGVMAPTVQDGWLVWEVPGKPISVRLSLDVVSRLGMAVQEGFKALPRRGLEIGGLLIGTARDAGNLTVVDVDDFEPVESEHATGPSYVLSDADRRLLKDRIAARQTSAKFPPVVGFYRSHSRKDFAITAEDASLFSTYCPKTSDVFLLIKSNEVGPPTGGFIIREDGKVLSDSPYAQFALDWTLGIRAAREAPVRAVQISPPPPPLSHVVQLPAPPRNALPTRTALTATWSSWLVTAGVLGLAVGLSFAILRRPPAPISANARPLALNVAAAGNGLRLSWDHQTSRPAGHAILWIKDGQDEQRFELDSKQLSEGSVTYWPKNSDVTFRLELLSAAAGVSVTESVRSIGGPSKALQIVPSPATAAVKAAPAPAAEVPRASPPVPKPSHETNRLGSASRQLSRTFVLPQPEKDSAAVAPARLPDPPVIQQAVAPALEHNKEFLKPIAPASGLESAASSIRVRVEPVPSSRLERLTRSLPIIGKRYRRPDYVPPAALRNPGLTSPSRSVSREVNIDVKVYVNPAGKVDYSEVLSKVAEPDRDLAASALFSARRWEFVPARDTDGTVPGEVILHYQFAPGPR